MAFWPPSFKGTHRRLRSKVALPGCRAAVAGLSFVLLETSPMVLGKLLKHRILNRDWGAHERREDVMRI